MGLLLERSEKSRAVKPDFVSMHCSEVTWDLKSSTSVALRCFQLGFFLRGTASGSSLIQEYALYAA